MNTIKVMIVFGARPEIIKMASVIDACNALRLHYYLVDTNQHYDENMSRIFLRQLGIKEPQYSLHVGSGTHGVQTGKALTSLERVAINEKPSLVLVQGDTNTTLAGALAAVKLAIPVGHIEAGLRSHDIRMPEEHNRRLVDHMSTYLFAPTRNAADNLRKEGVWGKTYVAGNTVIDACKKYVPVAENVSKIMDKIDFRYFALATVHRAENVDDKSVLKSFVRVFANCTVPVVFPAHPRTVLRLKQFGLWKEIKSRKNVEVISPVGYFDFLKLMKNSEFILTDSGGVQEEATSPLISKFVFVLRKTTDRPESVRAGFASVVGTNAQTILREISYRLAKGILVKGKCPFGNGRSGETIVRVLKRVLFNSECG